MCNINHTEYLICYIADYNSQLSSRNAVICRRPDPDRKICAVIQPIMANGCPNEVTIMPMDSEFKNLISDPFICTLPTTKDFQTLSNNDILTDKHL